MHELLLVKVVELLGSPINHPWKVNVHYLKVAHSLEFVMQYVKIHM